jgi:hypothetical protein
MESFFALLQKNVLDRCRWEIRDQLRLAIITWIERTYHLPPPPAATPTRQTDPIEYEMLFTEVALSLAA